MSTQLTRVQQGRQSEITITFTKAGIATDPTGNTATIEVLRGDGSTLVAAGTPTSRLTAGVYAFTLTPTHTGLLDRLTLRWTAQLDPAVPQTTPTIVEVAGGLLFDLQSARAMLNSGSTVTDAAIQEMRVQIEQDLEEAIQCALVPRWERETLDGERDEILIAKWPRITAVRGVSIAGTALTEDEIADQVAFNGRVLERVTGGAWPQGRGNVVIDYEHGYQLPPGRLARAGRILAQEWLQQGPLTERATTFASAEGGTFALMTAGMRGAMFGIPEVEAAIQLYDHHSRV